MNKPSRSSLEWALARWQNGNIELSYAFGVGQLAQALDIVVRELCAIQEEGDCFYCGEKTESLAGNPGRWPLLFAQPDKTGIVRHHHVRCVILKLVEGEDWKARAYEASTLNAELHRDAKKFHDWRERALTAALRYESRHDRDPERQKLWRELKTAICVEPQCE